jgi:2-polyprenyl-3-methyl-5-hydroxy-6-metoxy-1,4-benzoquinol methylase
VLCLEVLEHLAEPAAALAELARVARQAVILSVPHEPYFRIGNVLRGKHLDRWGDHPEHVQHWNPRTFRAFLEPSFVEVRLRNAFPWLVACCTPRREL